MVTLFALDRHEDISKVSGVGRVAYGFTLDAGPTLMTWRGHWRTLSFYPTPESVVSVHGHDGATELTPLSDDVAEQERGGALLRELVPAALTAVSQARRELEERIASLFTLQRTVPDGDSERVERLAVVARLESGHCLVSWVLQWPTLGWYPSLVTVSEIHGHDGKAHLVRLTDAQDREHATGSVLRLMPAMLDTMSEAQRLLPGLPAQV